MDHEWGMRTRAIHAGARPDAATGARAVPVYQTTSFVFEDAADAADLFALQKYGNIYSRIANPTVAAFEERMASLEGGIGAVATSSGQSAEFLTFVALAGAGDHVVASAQLYGGTHTLLDVTLRRLGISTTFVASDDSGAYAAAIRPETKLVYTELIANPSGSIADLGGLADVAHRRGIPLVVDATLATPALCRPLDHGADIVVHSATKFLGGHGTSIGGVVVESGRFPWDNGNFPTMVEPVASYGGLRFFDNFGEYAFCTKLRVEQLRDIGACLAPMNAFLFLQGLETLPLRMSNHVENTRVVAQHLEQHPNVSWVRWAGLATHPHFDRARHYLPAGPGRGVQLRHSRRARRRRALCRVGRDDQPPRERRGRAHPRHPSRVDDSPTAERRRARGRRRGKRSRANFRRPRRRRGHCLRPRPGTRSGGRGVTTSWHAPSARERFEIIRSTRTVAIVGASPNPARPSYFVATYLLSSSVDFAAVWFVNPTATETHGHAVYPSLASLPEPPDLVDVFRRAEDLGVTADEAIAVGASTLWFQLGLSDEDAAERAYHAGLHVVMNRCLKIEHARFAGGLHLAGFDTGVISSRRKLR